MKRTNNVKIYFCYPDIHSNTDKEVVINNIIREIQWNIKIGFAGFLKRSHLKDYLVQKYSEDSVETYKKLGIPDYKKIERIIQIATQKCFEQLPLSSLFVFVFPWLGVKFDKTFGGVHGFAPYVNTVHIFISLVKFSSQSLKETLAHELNHTVFFYHHQPALELTLLETFIFEGLAENFREEAVGGKPSSWSQALSEKQCKLALFSLKHSLHSRKYSLYQNVFFGGEKYKRWTGFSIGYRIVKSFCKTYPGKSWEEIMRIKPKTIFEMSPFTKK